MKKYMLLLLAGVAMLVTGCPIGLSYPLGEPGTTQIDDALVGTWVCSAEDPEVKEITIAKKDANSYKVTVLERGSMYSLETDNLTGWVTKVGGGTFVFFQPENEENYYHYQYRFEGNTMITNDVSLLDGGVDAVTSTESLRTQVETSMKQGEWANETLSWKKK